MTINQSHNEIRGNTVDAVTGLAQDTILTGTSQSGPSDGLQLTRLGGVLSAFQSNATESFARVDRLGTAVREQNYSVDGQLLGNKIVSEMLNH